MNDNIGPKVDTKLEEKAAIEDNIRTEPSTPLFMRDGPEGNKGNAQDEKDEREE